MDVGSQERSVLLPVIPNRVFLCDRAYSNSSTDDDFHYFCTDDLIYASFCDDFGPMGLACVLRFIHIFEKILSEHPGERIAYQVQGTPRKLTNAVFLLGSYLILANKQSPQSAWNRFCILESRLEMYRDATHSNADFRLSLLDCWRGLARANQLGWIDSYDMDEYSHYDNPLEGDIHVMVPGKLIAFKGPRTLPDSQSYSDAHGVRHFAPSFYIEPFSDMGVSTVVRLNEPEYDPSEFEQHGLRCVDLEFPDCTPPPLHIIVEFLYTVDRAAGAVAVHCKAGLGRTGTLIAVYMMRSHGFTAREAMGWLRVVRPGSVIGDQQHFLCELDPPVEPTVPAHRRAASAGLDSGGGASDANASVMSLQEDHAAALSPAESATAVTAAAPDSADLLAGQLATALHSPRRIAVRSSAARRLSI